MVTRGNFAILQHNLVGDTLPKLKYKQALYMKMVLQMLFTPTSISPNNQTRIKQELLGNYLETQGALILDRVIPQK